jgi:Fic family protein
MSARLEGLWSALRDQVIEAFPRAPGKPDDVERYLKFVDDIYQSDAYHSLSIEGYSVTPELVDRVRSGDWDPEHRIQDRNDRDALAARGYWQAFQRVKKAVAMVLGGASAGAVVQDAHREWYRELFEPFVAAGVVEAAALAGYRNAPVYIRDSRHVPPRAEAVREAMPTLFDLLKQEEDPAVRATLGHWLVGYIHPYSDGNGRMARFLMNVMLAAGGYPWTVIRVEDRAAYLAALEAASVESNIRPFAQFLAERVSWSIERTNQGKRPGTPPPAP